MVFVNHGMSYIFLFQFFVSKDFQKNVFLWWCEKIGDQKSLAYGSSKICEFTLTMLSTSTSRVYKELWTVKVDATGNLWQVPIKWPHWRSSMWPIWSFGKSCLTNLNKSHPRKSSPALLACAFQPSQGGFQRNWLISTHLPTSTLFWHWLHFLSFHSWLYYSILRLKVLICWC